jgi:hypothetical protein
VKRCIVVALVLAACPALGGEPQVGRWAADLQHCGTNGDTMKTAPLTVTANSLRWLSEYCSIGKMYKAERALYIEGRCSNSAGLMVRHAIRLAMKGERLAVTWNGEPTEMRRCP